MTVSPTDLYLFNLINQSFSSPWLDPVMNGVTALGYKPWILIPFWLLLILKGGQKGRIVGWLIIPLLLLSDMIPTYVLKPFFARPRPFMMIEGTNLLIDNTQRVSPYGFPSNHASNIFGVATFLSLAFRKKWLVATLFGAAFIVGFSRIYVGVHFPSDVAAGALLGIGLGFFFYSLSILIKNYKNPRYT